MEIKNTFENFIKKIYSLDSLEKISKIKESIKRKIILCHGTF